MHRNNHRGFSLSVLIAATSSIAEPTLAATDAAKGQVEEITVTATKRKEDVQRVPISMTALSGATLEKTGSVNLWGEGARILPGVYISKGLQLRGSTVQIRGVGSNGNNAGIEPSVGQYIDGVYQPQNGSVHANLLDLEDIEVLRGPQGTLFGRNSVVGAININTREPQAEPEAMIRASAGNYGSYGVSGYFGGGLTKDLDGRISGWVSHHDGYEKNLFDGRDVNDDSQYGARARLKWHPVENFTDNFIASYSHIDEHCCSPELAYPTAGLPISPLTPGYLAAAAAVGFPVVKFTMGDHTVDESVIGHLHDSVSGLSNKAEYQFAGGHTLTSITAMNAYDEHANPNGLSNGVPQPSYKAPGKNIDRSYSEEIRVTSPTGKTIDYVVGAFFYRQKLESQTNVGETAYANRLTATGPLFPAAATGADQYWFIWNQITNSQAVFAQATWNATSNLRLIGGLRDTWADKAVDLVTQNALGADATWLSIFRETPWQHLTLSNSKLTWQSTAQYDLSEQVMLYATYSTGFKDGGFSATKAGGGLSSPTNPYSFNPENSINYEAGIKSTFLDRKLRVNLDVFHFLEKQTQQSFFTILPGAASGTQVLGNLGNIKVDGFEWDVTYRPIEPLTLTFGGLADNAEIYNYALGPCPPYGGPNPLPAGPAPGTCNYNGRRPPRSPSLSYVWSAEWRQPVTSSWDGYMRWNGSYSGTYMLDNTFDARAWQNSYALIDARLGIASSNGRWDAAFWVKNITNQVWYTANSAGPGFGGQSAGGITGPVTGQTLYYGPPRTYGVDVTYRF